MRRGSLLYYILIVVLILLLFGVINLGDIFSVIGYIIGGTLLLVLIGGLAIRYKFLKMQRQAEEQGQTNQNSRTYNWQFGGASQERKRSDEGEVKIKRTPIQNSKRVDDNIGDYVDFEELKENTKED